MKLNSKLVNFIDAIANNEYCSFDGKAGYSKVGRSVIFTGNLYIKGIPEAYSSALVTNLPTMITSGFVAYGRSNQTGDVKKFWISGKKIMPAEPLDSGQSYALSFSYVAVA